MTLYCKKCKPGKCLVESVVGALPLSCTVQGLRLTLRVLVAASSRAAMIGRAKSGTLRPERSCTPSRATAMWSTPSPSTIPLGRSSGLFADGSAGNVCTHTCMHVYMHVCALTRMHTCAHACRHLHPHPHTCTHSQACTHTHTQAHMHAHTHTHTLTSTHEYTHTHTHS